MSEIFFTSDTHAFHKNICRGTTEWQGKGQGVRDFDTIEEMTELIVNNINSRINWNDTLYHIGDWSFNGADKIKLFRDRINCNNIHLIFGNHDQHITPIESQYRKLFTSCEYYKEISIGGSKNPANLIVMSHYPMVSWNRAAKGSQMLHGHEHGGVNKHNLTCKRLDVGIDSAKMILGDYVPFHIEEILRINNKKEILILGHHQD